MRSLWRCFAELDRRLLTLQGRAAVAPTDPPDYEQVEMPQGFDLEEFIATWERG